MDSTGIGTESSTLASKLIGSSSLGPLNNRLRFKESGPQNFNELGKNSGGGPEIMGLYSKGVAIAQDNKKDGPGVNIAVNRDIRKTCWDLHKKSVNWKSKQNKSRGNQSEKSKKSSSTFNSEQMEQLYKLLYSFHPPSQTSTNNLSSSLAHRGSFLKTLKSITV